MKKLYNTSVFYLVLGLLSGVFFREFTKIKNINGDTVLSTLHTHLLVLGFLMFLILIFAERQYKLTDDKKFNGFYIFYNIGLLIKVITMLLKGLLDVKNIESKAVSGIAGLGHIFLTIGLILLVKVVKDRVVKNNDQEILKMKK